MFAEGASATNLSIAATAITALSCELYDVGEKN